MANSKSKISTGMRGLLMTCMVVMVLPVLFSCLLAINSKMAQPLIITLPYLIAIGCSFAVVKGPIEDETFIRLIVVLDIIGLLSVIYFLWAYISFILTFTF